MSDFMPDDFVDLEYIELIEVVEPIDLADDVDPGELPDAFGQAAPGPLGSPRLERVAALVGLTATTASLFDRTSRFAKNVKAKRGRK